jgi:hypothetical protein
MRRAALGLIACGLGLLGTALVCRGQQASQPIYVGFLEDDRGELYTHPGPSPDRVVRVAFVKDGREGRLAESPKSSQTFTFTIAFDGKNLGSVSSRPRKWRGPADIATQSVVRPGTSLPAIGHPSKQFGGMQGVVVRRPLVVVSQPNYTDPDVWKRYTGPVPEPVSRNLHNEFFHRYPKLEVCSPGGSAATEWQYSAADVAYLAVYRSQKDEFLVETKLSRESGCDPSSNPDDPWARQWFLVASDLKVTRLGGYMTLLDAGDYDGDGQSEVIFFEARYPDQDGYILFYDHFQKRQGLDWTYE